VTALTSVENKANRSKHITYAVLLVAPEGEDPVVSANKIAPSIGYADELKFTNDIAKLRLDHPAYAEGRALIPVRFYYLENIDVGDETLSYRVPIEARRLNSRIPYAVRFFIFAERRLHRSTQDCFVSP